MLVIATRPALRKLLPVAAALSAAIISVMAGEVSARQKRGAGAIPLQGPPVAAVPRRRLGGYSMTLSDVWGPAKMPPAPKDFGPHFDFPPQPLEGGVSRAPYPD
jgi:hypothetical protein